MLVNTPPMGWNSWNTFGSKISDSLIRETADQFGKLGLDKAGYNYLVIDDCWSEKERDPATGRMLASREKFPNGMNAVSDYVHAKGLKFGMYSCAGVRTCAGYPGSFDHEFLDAKTFAGFGCDFLKYDFCYKPVSANGPLLYRRMGHALRTCGRDILFSACNWGSDDVWSWIRSAGAHMYRSTGDIMDNPVSFSKIAKSQMTKYCYSAPQCFNDMDMLTVGMFGKGNVGTSGCGFEQYKTQFSLWCIMGSPLMLGSDLRTMTPEVLSLVTNPELLAFNQDPEARSAFPVDPASIESGRVVLVKLLSDGDIAVGLFNLTETKGGVFFHFEDIGFPAASGFQFRVKDVFSGEEKLQTELSTFGDSLDPWSCAVFRMSPVSK